MSDLCARPCTVHIPPNIYYLHFMGYFLCLIGATGFSVFPVGNIDGAPE